MRKKVLLEIHFENKENSGRNGERNSIPMKLFFKGEGETKVTSDKVEGICCQWTWLARNIKASSLEKENDTAQKLGSTYKKKNHQRR